LSSITPSPTTTIATPTTTTKKVPTTTTTTTPTTTPNPSVVEEIREIDWFEDMKPTYIPPALIPNPKNSAQIPSRNLFAADLEDQGETGIETEGWENDERD